jgi:hypothetical protein
LHCRVKTFGVNEFKFRYDKNKYSLFLIGGQRNERKKWFNIISQTDLPIDVVSISDYNLLCYEDDTTNRLLESLEVFKDLAIMLLRIKK